MAETHEGICGNHIGGRALCTKILRAGYYWPTIKRDCIAKVQKCDNCQKHSTISTTPAEKLHTLEVEATNRVILQSLKKKLDNAKGEWADLIPEVLWGYNTTVQSSTGETPFKLVYGAEALIPVEIGVPTLRAELYDPNRNKEERAADLDLMDEEREIATIKQLAMKQFLQKRHNKRIIPRTFETGELILRKTEEARKPKAHGNLAANWEGPFRICKVLGKGAYQLETLLGEPVLGNWNVSSLRKYQS
ncbi:uncharacterized protein [Arachis hypogaea]|uniref:uncharacterized protein n=1 Tax=Arachis hypogaea TaxID=3818 RepID=UPI0007AFC45A